jgi:hypothetical protein
MPFEKVGPDEYQGPSGKKFDLKQVKLAEVTDNFTHMGKAKRIAGKRAARKR